VCEKFTIFTYEKYINGIVIEVFKNVLFYAIKVGIYKKFAKM